MRGRGGKVRGREGERVRRRGRGGDEERRRGEEEGEGMWYRERERKGGVQRVQKEKNLPTSAVREAIPPKMKGFSVLILV